MLVLSRKPGQRILIGEDVEVQVVATRAGCVKLGITAPMTFACGVGNYLPLLQVFRNDEFAAHNGNLASPTVNAGEQNARKRLGAEKQPVSATDCVPFLRQCCRPKAFRGRTQLARKCPLTASVSVTEVVFENPETARVAPTGAREANGDSRPQHTDRCVQGTPVPFILWRRYLTTDESAKLLIVDDQSKICPPVTVARAVVAGGFGCSWAS